jgi:hypothetical protein
MTIDCAEQERRIRDGFFRRHKQEIIAPVIGKQVHRICYRPIIQRQSLAVTRSISHPRKYFRRLTDKKSQSQDSNLSTWSSPSIQNDHELFSTEKLT